MSNTGKFIQKMIDKSRFKSTSPNQDERDRDNLARRQKILDADPLFQKSTQAATPSAGTGVLSQLRRRILKQQGILQKARA